MLLCSFGRFPDLLGLVDHITALVVGIHLGLMLRRPSLNSYVFVELQHVHRTSTLGICGVPLLPLGSKYRVSCMTCGHSERENRELLASVDMSPRTR